MGDVRRGTVESSDVEGLGCEAQSLCAFRHRTSDFRLTDVSLQRRGECHTLPGYWNQCKPY